MHSYSSQTTSLLAETFLGRSRGLPNQTKPATKKYMLTVNFLITEALPTTVEPVYNNHPRDLRNWLLNTGSLKIITGHGLMSI